MLAQQVILQKHSCESRIFDLIKYGQLFRNGETEPNIKATEQELFEGKPVENVDGLLEVPLLICVWYENMYCRRKKRCFGRSMLRQISRIFDVFRR